MWGVMGERDGGGRAGCSCSIFSWREERVGRGLRLVALRWQNGHSEGSSLPSCSLRVRCLGPGKEESRGWQGRDRPVICGRIHKSRAAKHQEASVTRQRPKKKLSCGSITVAAALSFHLCLCRICFAYRTQTLRLRLLHSC